MTEVDGGCHSHCRGGRCGGQWCRGVGAEADALEVAPVTCMSGAMEGFGDDLTQPGHEACMVVVGHWHASEEGGAELFTERLR